MSNFVLLVVTSYHDENLKFSSFVYSLIGTTTTKKVVVDENKKELIKKIILFSFTSFPKEMNVNLASLKMKASGPSEWNACKSNCLITLKY